MFLLRLLVISVQFQLYFSTGCCTNSVSSFISEYLKIYFRISSQGCPPHSVSSFSQARLSFQSSFLFFSSIDLPSNSVSFSLFPVVILPVQFQLSFSNIFYYKVSFIFILRLLVLRIHFHLSFLTLCSTKSVLSVFFHWLSYQLTLNLFIDWHSNNSVLSFFFT